MKRKVACDFLKSAHHKGNDFQSFDDFKTWFDSKNEPDKFSVKEIPFKELDKWAFDEENTYLRHESGKFFSIEAIEVSDPVGGKESWYQPIINQPEIGILGFIVKKVNGIYYFLVQAKMEPGNINTLQISPTVQATKSNYTQVHKGKLPTYLEHFLDMSSDQVLFDQLQTEQGGRFLRKRNRNIIIEIEDDIELHEDFKWLTLFELKELAKSDNILNMDTRSVLACVQVNNDIGLSVDNKWTKELMLSLENESLYSLQNIHSWLTNLKARCNYEIKKVPLHSLTEWTIGDKEIYAHDHSAFSINAVDVKAGNREVFGWTQPLLKDTRIGMEGLLCKKINGTLHFLMQGKFEPGNHDIIDIAPTVSFSDWKRRYNDGTAPSYIEHFVNAKNIIHDSLQSEEGGRFYHIQNRNMLIEIDENQEIEELADYKWMTLDQIYHLLDIGHINIETRSILSIMPF